MEKLEHLIKCMDIGYKLGMGGDMKTLQENLDTVEDCRTLKYENSQEYEPEGEGKISATDILQVMDIPGCRRISTVELPSGDVECKYKLPDGGEFMVTIKMEEIC